MSKVTPAATMEEAIEKAAKAHCFALEQWDRKAKGERSCPCAHDGECAVFEREIAAQSAAIAAYLEACKP